MTRIGSSVSPRVPSPSLLAEGQLPSSVASATSPPLASSASSASLTSSASPGEPSAFARLVGSLGQEANRGEAAMKTALSASTTSTQLGAQDLLALQAGVYRYGEVVDLASRLVDRASSNVKTVLQGSGS